MPIARLTLIVASLLVLSLTLGCAATPTAVPPTQVPAAPTVAAGALPPMGAGAPPASKALVSVAPIAKDLAYASVSNAQKLDLYVPQGAGPFPLIVAVHGGEPVSWQSWRLREDRSAMDEEHVHLPAPAEPEAPLPLMETA